MPETMMSESCKKKIEELRNTSNITSVLPDIPVAIVLQEAMNLYDWCKTDKEILTGKGFEWNLAEDIPIRVEALSRLETAWATERSSVKVFQKEWRIALPEALQLRTDLFHHFRHAFRSNPSAKAKVKMVSRGNTHADMIQDLIDLWAIGKEYQSELKKVGFDIELLDKAYRLSFELGKLLAKVNSERTEGSQQQRLRNKAYYHLKEAVDALRKTGQYAFLHNEERRTGYCSAYIRNRNLKSRKKKT